MLKNEQLSLAAFKVVARVYEPLIGFKINNGVQALTLEDKLGISSARLEVLRRLMRPSSHAQLATYAKHADAFEFASFEADPEASSRFCKDVNQDKDILDRQHDTNYNSGYLRSFDFSFSLKNDTVTANRSDDVGSGSTALHTAVCLVGVPRTMTREIVLKSLRRRFLSGWGLNEVTVFVLLVNDHYSASKMKEVEHSLPGINIAWAKWLNGSHSFDQKYGCCADGRTMSQIKQWLLCGDAIQDFEATKKDSFKAVMKIRPDDLWYGPIVPHCAFLKNRIYASSHTDKKMSDQWWLVPREVLTDLMKGLRSRFHGVCDTGGSIAGLRTSRPVQSGGENAQFELSVHDIFSEISERWHYKLSIELQPRIITRPDPLLQGYEAVNGKDVMFDSKKKCATFFKFEDRFDWSVDDCVSLVLGRHKKQASI